MSSIEIYAELLNNIRAVTLVITLQTESNQETKALLSADGQTITVSHEDQSASIRLPTQMEGGGTATITLPAAPSKSLTLRLQLEETAPGLLKPGEDSSENVAPWSATDLTGLSISCRECGAGLLKDAAVREWRDLPNENWAEMMDFWHCHKPHDEEQHESHEEVAKKKGYSSSDHFRSTPGLGFVALSYLLLAEGDCQKISARKSNDLNQDLPVDLICSLCESQVGIEDKTSVGWRLFKWSIAAGKPRAIVSHPLQKWLSVQLLAAIETEGVRRFILEAPGSGDTASAGAILVWVFTDDLSFSSSINEAERIDPTRAMKVFWKDISNLEGALRKNQHTLEQITIPGRLLEGIKESLKTSGELLPPSGRTFQDWQIGLLQRFRSADVSSQGAFSRIQNHNRMEN